MGSFSPYTLTEEMKENEWRETNFGHLDSGMVIMFISKLREATYSKCKRLATGICYPESSIALGGA